MMGIVIDKFDMDINKDIININMGINLDKVSYLSYPFWKETWNFQDQLIHNSYQSPWSKFYPQLSTQFLALTPFSTPAKSSIPTFEG